MKDIIDLHEALKVAGFAITGLAGEPPDVKIVSWEGQPSKDDETRANDFIKSFDWTTPTDAEIKDHLSKLTVVQKQAVLDAALEQLALANPKLLDRAISSIRS